VAEKMAVSSSLLSVYDMTVNLRLGWQAQSQSNVGSNGSNRLLPRQVLLGDGTLTGAGSGNIVKHYHAALLKEYFHELGVAVCPACRRGDGRRAMALLDEPEYKDLTVEKIIQQCGICDAHGFLVTAKKASKPLKETDKDKEVETEARQRVSKHSLVEFSYALACPGHYHETTQITTRLGASKEEGQMLMKMPVLSGEYARCIRYRGVGVGVDTDKWQLVVQDESERLLRHRAILSATRDTILSPEGALTATQLPHLTGIVGAIVVQTTSGRAPLWSALDNDFVTQLKKLSSETCQVFTFESASEFSEIMNELIRNSVPSLPACYRHQAN
jgi:CRISPR-associated protein Cst2